MVDFHRLMALNKRTKDAGLVKGETACNRSTCQEPIAIGERYWNQSTEAYYCRPCANAINIYNTMPDGTPCCIPEAERQP